MIVEVGMVEATIKVVVTEVDEEVEVEEVVTTPETSEVDNEVEVAMVVVVKTLINLRCPNQNINRPYKRIL